MRRGAVKQLLAQSMLLAWIKHGATGASSPLAIKVGAHDGVTGDPSSRSLLETTRWQVCLVEPVPWLFERLKLNYADNSRFTCVNAAINSDGATSASLYMVDRDRVTGVMALPDWWDQIASLDQNHIVKCLVLGVPETEIEVESMTLASLVARHRLNCVALLQIDTEGHDLNVLNSFDFNTGRPAVIFLEIAHLSAGEMASLGHVLIRQGYRWRVEGTTDLIAFANGADFIGPFARSWPKLAIHVLRELKAALGRRG